MTDESIHCPRCLSDLQKAEVEVLTRGLGTKARMAFRAFMYSNPELSCNLVCGADGILGEVLQLHLSHKDAPDTAFSIKLPIPR